MITSDRQLPVRLAKVAAAFFVRRRVVLEPELGVLLQRFEQAELRALEPDLVGDVDRRDSGASRRSARKRSSVRTLARRREQAIGEQRIGRRRRRRGGAGRRAGRRRGATSEGRARASPCGGRRRRVTAITSQTGHVAAGVFAAAGRSSGAGVAPGGDAERAFDGLEEGALLAQDEAPGCANAKFARAVGIGLEARAVGLVGGEESKRDQAPGDRRWCLVRQEVADQVAAAARDDAAPVRGVGARTRRAGTGRSGSG